MQTVPRIEQYRDEAKRTARRAIIVRPIAVYELGYEFLEQIQEREEVIRWLLNCRPYKKNRCSRSKTFWKG